MVDSIEIVLPDIGDYKDVPIVEINVAVGDDVVIDTPLLSIESDKATMEVPSPAAGKVKQLMIEVGSLVSQGSILMILEAGSASDDSPAQEMSAKAASSAKDAGAVAQGGSASIKVRERPEPSGLEDPGGRPEVGQAHASPSVRALARELGVPLALVVPSGAKGRVLHDDVTSHVKQVMGSTQLPPSAIAPALPRADYEKFGAIERVPLSRIQQITGANLSRNWSTIPHVTNFDKADVTEAEAFRKNINGEAGEASAKLTMVSILIKAAALALKKYPRFNSSFDQDALILKKYIHIGFAVDTPKGLVVPVIRDCDKKGLIEIASEMRALADKALGGQLSPGDMQGGCISVSSLGGVGGHGFTPIINAPEVAILGAGRAVTEAVWDGSGFQPRQMLPITLSWDHRVVDGVAAARFLGFVATLLNDLRRYAL
ncbi:pyruvate dehydrogenase E2 component (dihydrolipoamide acetyltransferase) [Bradyrhizobium sp. Rc2d]|uniref:2-oxo acid dehydrogenase subunit E2 n=1 Tax=Bradyrhizobium sp. Rc2d TaxID=1855321 RepID=UPI000886484B|nr:2-oxo acid dehydrogenase subunit E2 [Bradyrhizobium sp. Rc2d]SDI26542.1 pyruvate dehydrogenase E2 component (dihydrolipoamide acetyltransferase) [Bradyrhizobium sp. Rc2d]